jgi:predicted nucleic acid-binding protein
MDDQKQSRIREEAEAVEQILRMIRTRALDWASSVVLEYEIHNNPDVGRRRGIEILLLMASETLSLNDAIVGRAKSLEAAGYGALDALHLSVAEANSVDVLLTTDDGFVRRAVRGVGAPHIRILNPLAWLKEGAA